MSPLPKTLARLLTLMGLVTVLGMSPAAALTASTYEKQVHQATNTYRTDRGKVAVKHQSCVDRWAESQARWMADRGVLNHRTGRLGKIMKDCRLTRASENIAWNYRSGNQAVSAWKKSSGHAKNMRAAKMRYMGVGAVKDRHGQWWVAQVFGARR